MELESAMEGRQKMLEEATSRINELEESQATLKAQVGLNFAANKRPESEFGLSDSWTDRQ